MPANVSPEYRKAEQAFRAAREPRERLACLQEMLRTIPKHKGTEHIQADIKSRIKLLTEELAGPRKGGVRRGPSHAIRPEGAAQLCLVGPPNAGKSALHARLTGSRAEVGPYPYTTKRPMPGMLAHRDIQFQLVDLPPVSAQFIEPWFTTALQSADGILLVVDLSDPETPEHLLNIVEQLARRKVALIERWPGRGEPDDGREEHEAGDEVEDPFRLELPTLLLANKCDLDPGPEEARILEELVGVSFPHLSVSAETGRGIEALGTFLFESLGIVRVFTKVPGKAAEDERPFALREGATVEDVARQVHKDLATTLRFARIWGGSTYDGQQVGPEHRVSDGDVIELHTR